MDRFEDGRAVADVGAGREAEAADQAAGEVGENVAEQVFHHHHVERVRIHHQLHAGGVDDAVVGLDRRIALRRRAGTCAGTGRR